MRSFVPIARTWPCEIEKGALWSASVGFQRLANPGGEGGHEVAVPTSLLLRASGPQQIADQDEREQEQRDRIERQSEIGACRPYLYTVKEKLT